jgi:hypothetical protein
MSQPIIQTITKQGTSISKQKLIDTIKQSTAKQFTYASENNGKTLVVVIAAR